MELHEIYKAIRENHGPWYYEMQFLGYNYRMTDIQAALGSSQMEKLDMFIAKRKEIVSAYNQAFGEMPEVYCSLSVSRRGIKLASICSQIESRVIEWNKERSLRSPTTAKHRGQCPLYSCASPALLSGFGI